MRPDKRDYYLRVAETVSLRSTCLRRRYGAIIVNNDEIVGTGYNGSARGEFNCSDGGAESCFRKRNNIPQGEQYEKCVAIHAEVNAIISAGRKLCQGASLYLFGVDLVTGVDIHSPEPCVMCARLIKNAGIKEVITNAGTFPVERRMVFSRVS